MAAPPEELREVAGSHGTTATRGERHDQALEGAAQQQRRQP